MKKRLLQTAPDRSSGARENFSKNLCSLNCSRPLQWRIGNFFRFFSRCSILLQWCRKKLFCFFCAADRTAPYRKSAPLEQNPEIFTHETGICSSCSILLHTLYIKGIIKKGAPSLYIAPYIGKGVVPPGADRREVIK